MKAAHWIALVSGIVIPLQGATFGYVVSVERRITRLETLIERGQQQRPAVTDQAGPLGAGARDG